MILSTVWASLLCKTTNEKTRVNIYMNNCSTQQMVVFLLIVFILMRVLYNASAPDIARRWAVKNNSLYIIASVHTCHDIWAVILRYEKIEVDNKKCMKMDFI